MSVREREHDRGGGFGKGGGVKGKEVKGGEKECLGWEGDNQKQKGPCANVL